MKILKIVNEVFEFNVEWLLSDDINEISEYLWSKWMEYTHNEKHWGITRIWNYTVYLYLPDKSDYILVHECIHAIQGVLDSKGIDTGYENTEVLAYNVDWLYRKLLHSYYKHKKNKKYKDYE